MCLEINLTNFQNLDKTFVYVDGNNVAYSRNNGLKKPVLSDILSVINYLIEIIGFKKENIYCICDPSLRYYIDKPIEFEELVKEKVINIAPKAADEFILSFALKRDFCLIVSNDKFRDFLDQLPSKEWLEDRRVTFMIMENEICLSPNMNFEKIQSFTKKDPNFNDQEPKNQTKTTLDVLK